MLGTSLPAVRVPDQDGGNDQDADEYAALRHVHCSERGARALMALGHVQVEVPGVIGVIGDGEG
jgi:hypothetical protein